ncbi:hypothetical protein Tcan_00167 [Toxocara canis]|uniref:Uncharacterized protein n=1 Tax=Toxocara canis TaxID=6265 RepID=A0A0B2UY63_TOXCA|nr:hypothetical protein Tcan_00167 [Toxocara canis]
MDGYAKRTDESGSKSAAPFGVQFRPGIFDRQCMSITQRPMRCVFSSDMSQRQSHKGNGRVIGFHNSKGWSFIKAILLFQQKFSSANCDIHYGWLWVSTNYEWLHSPHLSARASGPLWLHSLGYKNKGILRLSSSRLVPLLRHTEYVEASRL